MDHAAARRQTGLICLGLTLAVLAAYERVWGHDFINLDDPDYVTLNSHVHAGLTWKGIIWAFTSGHASNWHPLTWISLMLDCLTYGLNPAGFHVTNLLLHAAGSVLLFLVLQELTRAAWPSALVAALFALHPMHVESVAWISERKDVLSGLFFMLTLLAYGRYAANLKSQIHYRIALVCFALGLLAKPMLVTLPFALLLLDAWPAGRWNANWPSLIVEKAPFFVLSLASCVVTYFVQLRSGAVITLSGLSFGVRLASVPVAYVRYLGKLFWPSHLAVWYPFFAWPPWIVGGSIVLLLAISALAFWQWRSRPWLAVGWLWFLGTLVPVIGLVQVGMQSMADRYTYIPSIGIFIMVAWSAREIGTRLGQLLPSLFAAAILATCFVLTAWQVAYWKDSGTLFQHAIKATPKNYVAYEMLGAYEAVQGQTNAAIRDLETSLQFVPDFAFAHEKLGHIFLAQGRLDNAETELREAIAGNPGLPDAHYDLGYFLLAKGKPGEALDQFQQQVNLQPDDFKAQHNMGAILLQNGLALDAVPFLQKAVNIDPANAGARCDLGSALFQSGRISNAASQYEESLRLDAHQTQSLNNLAWILACSPDPVLRDGKRAQDLAREADKLSLGTNAAILGTLAAADAEAGKFSDAIAVDKHAAAMARAQTNNALADVLEIRLRAYEAGKPWRDGTK